jgi:ketosteroid isomerase-like protein
MVMAGDNEIRAAEAALYQAMIAKDIAALDKILEDDVAYIHSPGFVESKSEYLAGVKKGLYDYAAITSRNVTIKMLGNTAIMHGIVEMKVSEIGKPRNLLNLLFTLVWVRVDGAWRLSLRQATRVPST